MDKAPRWLRAVETIGPLLLFLAATVYGVIEVHSSTDTYIGLAGGRSIVNALSAGEPFPVKDTFSYTFYEKPWLNQNWLTHVWQYWLYSDFGPDAVIWGTWAMSASIFLFCLFGCWMRSDHLFGSLVAASFVAIGCHNFISARPATTGFFAISAMAFLICALEGQRHKRRWWPIVVVAVLLIAWGCAHGSFVFGYVIFAIYVAYWVVLAVWRKFMGGGGLAAIWFDVAVFVITVSTTWYIAFRTIKERFIDTPDMMARAVLLVSIGALVATVLLVWHFVRDRRRPAAISGKQVVGLIGALIVAFLITLLAGPFGFENFTHGEKVAASEAWRGVSEWNPPYAPGNYFPPVLPFWTIFAITGAILLATAGLWFGFRGAPVDVDERTEQGRPTHISAFDVLMVVIGLIMTMFARRFAPVFYIFAAPTILTAIVMVGRRMPTPVSQSVRWGSALAALVACGFVGWTAVSDIQRTIISKWRANPDDGLLGAVTMLQATPQDAIRYLDKNGLDVNVLTEWTQAGILMFYAPRNRVYMDGRAQQVYSEEHYGKYSAMLLGRGITAQNLGTLLDEHNTQVVFARKTPRNLPLLKTLLGMAEDWAPILDDPQFIMFMRVSDPAMQRLRDAREAGREWRPNTVEARFSLGTLLFRTSPSDAARALELWRSSIAQRPLLGITGYYYVAVAYASTGDFVAGQRYFQQELRKISALTQQFSKEQAGALADAAQKALNSLMRVQPRSTP